MTQPRLIEWGKRVVRDLGNAHLLTYRGDGHGVITGLTPASPRRWSHTSRTAHCRRRVPPANKDLIPDAAVAATLRLDDGQRTRAAERGLHWRAR